MENSFIKIYRGLLDWEWFKDSNMVHLYIYLLVKANYADNRFQGVEVKRGQLITGRKSLSFATGISENSIRTCLDKLVSTNEITIQTTNKFSLVTIVKYDDYQSLDAKPTSKKPTKQPATNQQPTTSKEEQEEQEKSILIPSEFEFLDYCKTIKEIDFKEFEFALKNKYNSWVQNNWKDGNDAKIKNWKSKINNTIPYLKPMKQVNRNSQIPNAIG